jgi:hypothetical protein
MSKSGAQYIRNYHHLFNIELLSTLVVISVVKSPDLTNQSFANDFDYVQKVAAIAASIKKYKGIDRDLFFYSGLWRVKVAAG